MSQDQAGEDAVRACACGCPDDACGCPDGACDRHPTGPSRPEVLADPAALARLTPEQAVTTLVGADLDGLSDAALVEAVAAWQRVASWAVAQSARAAGALAERDSMNPDWPQGITVGQPCIAGDELAMRLGWSRMMATRLVADGRAYEQAMAWTGDALADGAICPIKARVLVDGLAEQPLEVALEVQGSVLGDAPGLTPTQLARRVAREILRIDPDAARARHERARAKRRVDRPKMLPGEMAGIWAVVEATDALRLDNGIDALARSAKAAGDPRTLDQLRADLFVDIALGRLCPGPAGSDGPEHPAIRENPDGDGRADGVARGGIRDGTLGHGITDLTDLTDLTDVESVTESNGERAHGTDVTGTGARDTESSGTPAHDTQSNGTQTHDTQSNGTQTHDTQSSATEAAGTGSVATATAPSQACPPVTPDLPMRAIIRVTVPLSTLLGTSEEPGELAGYGPIHPDTARALALGGPWQRIVTDPLSGNVLDVGRTRYRPPAALAEHVIVRDRTCISPSCSTDAHACDLDHTVPFGDGGHTAAHNIGPVCRRDHLLKTHGGAHIEQPKPGDFIYRSPTGQRYDITPGSDRGRRHIPPTGPGGRSGQPPDRRAGARHGREPASPLDHKPGHLPDRERGHLPEREPGHRPDRGPGHRPGRSSGDASGRSPGRQHPPEHRRGGPHPGDPPPF